VTFDGKTFSPELDLERLSTQLSRVKALMSDGNWRTLCEIASQVNGSEAGCSARLRDLRKAKFGGLKIERKRLGESGLWVYRLSEEQIHFEDNQRVMFA
jgi:hypothetical protein